MNDIKYKLQQLQQKDKWSFKGLVAKRHQIEQEKSDMKKKLVEQSRDNERKAKCNLSLSHTLEKKVGCLNQKLNMT